MQRLEQNEIQLISGGCEEHCWGDFELGGLAAATVGSGIAGATAGPVGAAFGALAGAVTYMLDVAWTD